MAVSWTGQPMSGSAHQTKTSKWKPRIECLCQRSWFDSYLVFILVLSGELACPWPEARLIFHGRNLFKSLAFPLPSDQSLEVEEESKRSRLRPMTIRGLVKDFFLLLPTVSFIKIAVWKRLMAGGERTRPAMIHSRFTPWFQTAILGFKISY